MAGDVTVETIDLGDGTTVRAEVIGEVIGEVGFAEAEGAGAAPAATPAAAE
ncbi:hypothetical protein [Kitasatospora sp. NPDC059088]|uniref:hypothetical protein n=1 Tax=unclassified Kitasatospora TaxID=2633591 RepID=UPI00367857B7